MKRIGAVALAALAAGVMTGCDSEGEKTVGKRVAALPDAAWEGSQWLSAKDAPVLTEKQRTTRYRISAPGSSWFVLPLANPGEVTQARWMTAGLGLYELYVNGRRVGTEALKPGFTDGRKTKRSFTYDVTDALRRGKGEANFFAAEVSAGWWRDLCGGHLGAKSAFRAVLELTFADGTTKRYGTNPRDWRAGVGGPVQHADIYCGETYDARVAPLAMSVGTLGEPEVNTEFKGAILPSEGAEVVRRCDLALAPIEAYCWKGVEGADANRCGRVVKTRTFDADGTLAIEPGETLIVDFGQNCAGVPYFRFSADAGTTLTGLPAEMLNDAFGEKSRGNDGPGGSVYRANLRMPNQGMALRYTFAGNGVEAYLPRFTFFGYRYISFTATAPVTIETIRSVPVTSITKEMECGTFETGVADVNKLIRNVYWGQLSNYLSVPTDCPQRDERLGWTADTQVFAEAGAYNADTYAFLRKFLRDMRDAQRGPDEEDTDSFTCVAPWGHYRTVGGGELGWSDGGIVIPYVLWKHTGRTAHLDEHWDAMVRFMNWLKGNRYVKGIMLFHQYNDWLSYEKYETCSETCYAKDERTGKTWRDPNNLRRPLPETAIYWKYLGGCYWLMDARMMAKMAEALGKADAVKEYAATAAEALRYLRDEVLEDGRIPACLRDMQTPALFALHCGLLDKAEAEATKKRLLQNFKDHGDCLQTGFLGTSILMDTLTEIGAVDVAYTLLLQHKNPSWLYSVDQGATTIWERWNSYTKATGFGPVSMNSFNHYAYGAVLAWMYKTVAGIASDPEEPGFRRIVMAPKPDRRLGYAKAEYRSAAGLIKSAWRYEGETWIWTFTVPDGATARVTVPGEAEKDYGPGTHTVRKTGL